MQDNLAEQIAAKRAQMLAPEPHEPAPIPTKFQDRVAEVESGLDALFDQGGDDAALILQLSDAVGGVPPHDQGAGQLVITSHEAKAIVNAALAQAANLKRQAEAISKRRDAIVDVLKAALGDDEELVVDGVVLATYKSSTARVLNQIHLKKVFPDTPENAECWTNQDRRTFLLK